MDYPANSTKCCARTTLGRENLKPICAVLDIEAFRDDTFERPS